ncbi:MAG: glycoside hydrolase family 3 C-terminal domain-containing protein [Dysgonamonadaceae bacterium]|jgi:beta-glucosidase-like glycosyl hydrolase|nr:glycoside hydrolase family 3 C-terminal domain-containing protein [Dysgonamonadaceae bacterium]
MKKHFFTLLFLLSFISYGFSQTLISQGKTAWASSEENGGTLAYYGNDGNAETRWGSQHYEGEWWAVDLGKEYHIFRVEIDWETAYSKEYRIEVSNDLNFTNPVEIAHVTNSPGGKETVLTNIGAKGRYLRLVSIQRNTGYGASFWELRVYGAEQLTPVNIQLDVPYVQYLKVRLTPADNTGTNEVIIQNNNGGTTVNLNYNLGSPIRIDLLDFRGNFDIDFWTYKEGTTEKIHGIPFNTTIYNNMVIHVELTPREGGGPQPPIADAGKDITIYAPANSVTLDGSRSLDRDGTIQGYSWEQTAGPNTAVLVTPNQATTTASNLILGEYKFKLTVVDNDNLYGSGEVTVSVLPPEQIDFTLIYPANKGMVTDSRTPTLTWNACPEATKYEIYVNISRSDYNWHASGNLLDRYTKVGESTINSYKMQTELVDRWTYKWYVIATTPQGTKFSEKRQFGLYIPVLETENDGVNIVNGCRDMNKNGTIEPFENWKLTPEERVADLMNRLSMEDKFQQLYYGGDQAPNKDGFAFSYGTENGMREVQYAAAKTPFGIPVAFLGDKMHGWKTIFPTQLGMAATRDMDLVYQVGNLQRVEHKAFGFTGTLAPLAEVSTKVLYPRIQEGGGENADEVAAMVRALVCGMQGGPEINPHSMMVTVKHWPGQGAGGEGPTQYDAVTIQYHLRPWYATIDANAASVMPGYSSSPYLDPSGEGSNTSKLILDYLRNKINFNGFIVTDWLAATTEQSINSIGAGIDVLGGAPSAPTDLQQLVAAVGVDRINEAARRVLETKIRLGMFENPYSDPTCSWTNSQHHGIVLNAARKSVTLLKNNNVLPLRLNAGDELVVAGLRANWAGPTEDPNVIWQSVYYENPQAKTYLKALQDRAGQNGINVFADNSTNPKVAVVVIGEKSYTHGTEWDDKNPNIPVEQLNIIQNFKARGAKVITVVILPRPYVLTPVIEASDAVIAVYRGGNGIGQATAECIFGDFAPMGKLPFQIPLSQDQVGTDNTNNQIEKWDLPYDIGAAAYEREQIRGYIERGEAVPPIFGNPLFQYGFGIQGFGVEDNTPPTAFNLVSPADNSQLESTSVNFTWTASTDPESSIAGYQLFIDDVLRATPTTTNATINVSDAGAHTWYVKAVNGAQLTTQSSAIYHFTIKGTALSMDRSTEQIVIFPNPSSGLFQLNVPVGIQKVSVIDLKGRVLLEQEVGTGTTFLDLSAYSPGVYLLRATGDKQSVVGKLIKK